LPGDLPQAVTRTPKCRDGVLSFRCALRCDDNCACGSSASSGRLGWP
jgi:hypothetical protein